MVDLTAGQARRIALAAQHFGRHPPPAVNAGHLRRLLRRLGAVQIDAVNVLVRAHYLPFFSRLGSYPVELLDRLVYRSRLAFEYWGHAASLVPVELYPALRYRMERRARDPAWLATVARIERERPGYLAATLREITERGPLTFGELTDPGRREKTGTTYAASTLLWYRWSDGKTALEGLFTAGQLGVADRRGFDRRYDLIERVLPGNVLAAPALAEPDGQRELVRHGLGALGVATVKEVSEYFRLPVAATRARLRELVAAGEVVSARVEGWAESAFLDPGVRPLAAVDRVSALLGPFDSLIWDRARTKRLFGFRHSFELYVPAARRRYGYYVLPFLLGDAIVARVDLKADRDRRVLLVQGGFTEPDVQVPVAEPLGAKLRELAGWLGLDSIEVADRGDLAVDLRKAVSA